MKDKIKSLQKLRKERDIGGGIDKTDKRHTQGKMTARERIEYFFDPGTFVELQGYIKHRSSNFGLEKKKFLGDGVVSGFGKVNDKLVYIYSQDFTVLGGSLGEMHAKKILNVMDLALKVGAPIVGINDSGGARIQEGINSLAGYGDIFYRNTISSGVIPQISVIMGPCAGGAVYSPGITDFVFMVNNASYMFVTGPEVIKAVNKEEVTFEALGGAESHSTISGVAHFVGSDEKNTLDMVKELLGYIPSSNIEESPITETNDPFDRMEDDLNEIVPVNPNKPYDMKKLITLIVDDYKYFEVHQNYAKNLIVGFARLGGKTVGIVANNPDIYAGTLDVSASLKGSRFIRFCDAFNIPLLILEDVPGFMPGTNQEYNGIIKNGAKFLYAFAEATVPKITVIVRKAYGGAYCVMSSKHIRGDINLAWPTAEIAVMGPEGGVEIVYNKEIKESEDKDKKKKELKEKYIELFSNPYNAAKRGYIDDVIVPANTRIRLIKALEMLSTKEDFNPSKKHGNIPL